MVLIMWQALARSLLAALGQPPNHAVLLHDHLQLHRAAAAGDPPPLRRLLVLAASLVTATDPNGCTPLHVACANGHAPAAALLLHARASVHAVDHHGATPLLTAAANAHDTIVRPSGSIPTPPCSHLLLLVPSRRPSCVQPSQHAPIDAARRSGRSCARALGTTRPTRHGRRRSTSRVRVARSSPSKYAPRMRPAGPLCTPKGATDGACSQSTLPNTAGPS